MSEWGQRMDREVDGGMRVGWPGGLGLALVWCAFAAVAVGAEEARVGPERCGECHKLEFRAWDRSHHALLLSDSESEEVLEKSEEIPSLLGIDDIETDAAPPPHPHPSIDLTIHALTRLAHFVLPSLG